MIRLQRLVYYFLILVFFIFIYITILPHLKAAPPTAAVVNSSEKKILPPPKKADLDGEKYLSWFPHSGFPEQQEGFRNALRLALETKRTIIAPMLRINKFYSWLPFEDLAQRYEAQDKTILRELCAKKQKNWRTELEPCETINDWIEIPWSSVMDLEAVKKDYGIRIIERTNGHGWGIHESALGGNIHPDDVIVVDVMSFKENGTDWEQGDPEMEALKEKTESRLGNWIQSHFYKSNKEEKLTQPLKYVFYENQLNSVDTKIIQFGALNSAARYQTSQNEVQSSLRLAMMKTIFNVPDAMEKLTAQANLIVRALGGKFQYSTLILNLSNLVELDARAGSIQNLGDSDKNAKNQAVNANPLSIEGLSSDAKKALMEAVVLEIFGDIPINQAISAAMPIQQSPLHTLLNSGGLTNSAKDRRQLLEACVDYHMNVEKRYPIYYLMTDIDIAPETRPDIFGPLLEMFPCIFSKADMLKWGIQTDSWSLGQPGLTDHAINYEKLLQPTLDILIAGKGYSFFEIPTSPLTRFLNWSPKK